MDNRILISIAQHPLHEVSTIDKPYLDGWKSQSTANSELWKFMEDVEHYQPDLIAYSSYAIPQANPEGAFAQKKWQILIAILLILAVVATVIFSSAISSNSETQFALLPDNTKVQLYKNSQLVIKEDFNRNGRQVQLEGKAFFDVAHNPELPFIIETDLGQIIVKGTSFTVEELGESVHVNVREGVVEFKNSNYSKLLTKGQSADFSRSGSSEVSKTNFDSDLISAIFKNATLEEIFNRLVADYDINISVSSELKLDSCFYNGTFENASIFDLLEEWGLIFELKYDVIDNTIRILDVKC